MGEDSQNNQDSFERHYNRFKDGVLPEGFRVAESQRVLSDKILTQYLRKNFNEESGIPMDRVDTNAHEITDIEAIIIAANDKNWQPDYSEGLVSDTVKSVSEFIFGEEQKTPEQLLSDQNATVYLNEDSSEHARSAVNNIIAHTPSLTGFTLENAKAVARAELSTEGNGADILAKFPEADPSTLKAVAYAMLHVNRDDVHDADLQGQKFAELARGHMHYAHEESETYDEWEMDRRTEIINAITSNPEVMADMALIKAPGNIETASDLQTQFRVRERIADAIAVAAAKSYGMSDILTGDDVTVVHKSRADMEADHILGYMGSSGLGILNDEVVFIRYNPAYFLMEHSPELAKTDHDEVGFFLKTSLEEIQHGIDQIQTDRLVLGTLPEGAPLEHHATMSALNRVTYAERGDYEEYADYYEVYSTQYLEKTAKAIADDVAFEVVYSLENPEEGNNQAVEQNHDNSSDTAIEQAVLPAETSLPFKI